MVLLATMLTWLKRQEAANTLGGSDTEEDMDWRRVSSASKADNACAIVRVTVKLLSTKGIKFFPYSHDKGPVYMGHT